LEVLQNEIHKVILEITEGELQCALQNFLCCICMKYAWIFGGHHCEQQNESV